MGSVSRFGIRVYFIQLLKVYDPSRTGDSMRWSSISICKHIESDCRWFSAGTFDSNVYLEEKLKINIKMFIVMEESWESSLSTVSEVSPLLE